MKHLQRYLKTKSGDKTEMKVTSVNITKEQSDWLSKNELSLSLITRDAIDSLMKQSKKGA